MSTLAPAPNSTKVEQKAEPKLELVERGLKDPEGRRMAESA